MPFEFEIRTTKKTEKFLKEFPKIVRRALIAGTKNAMLFAESKAKKSFGRSDTPGVKTGRLRRSIRNQVRDRGNLIVGSIGSDLIYARVQERGATIRARNAPYLKFQIGSRWVTVASVTIPKREYLRPAIEDNLRRLGDIIQETVEKAVEDF